MLLQILKRYLNGGFSYWFGLVLLLFSSLTHAADYAREKRWANEVVPGIIIGEPIYLKQSKGHQFLGL